MIAVCAICNGPIDPWDSRVQYVGGVVAHLDGDTCALHEDREAEFLKHVGIVLSEDVKP